MKAPTTLVVLVFCAVLKSGSTDTAPEWQLLRGMKREEWPAVIEKFTPEKKKSMIAEIKSAEADEIGFRRYAPLLLSLGDNETRQRLFNEVSRGENAFNNLLVLKYDYDPRTIEGFGAFLVEPVRFQKGSPDYPFPWRMGGIMLNLLEKTPGFSKPVYEWQRGMLRGHPVEMFPILLRWWKANEAHFRAGNYLAVQPGEYPDPDWPAKHEAHINDDGTITVTPIAQPTPAPPQPVQSTLPDRSAPATPKPSPAPASPTLTTSGTRSNVTTIVLASLIMLVAISGLLLFRRR